MKRLAPLFLCAFAGCGPGGPDNSIAARPVTGSVYYMGQPAAGVKVFFLPTSAPVPPTVPRNPQATTRADGSFALGTFSESDGAAEGGYQILLSWPDELGRTEEAEDRLMGWYDVANSKEWFQVKAGANAVPPIRIGEVKGPPPPSFGVPGRN